jgi:hypothetical protein
MPVAYFQGMLHVGLVTLQSALPTIIIFIYNGPNFSTYGGVWGLSTHCHDIGDLDKKGPIPPPSAPLCVLSTLDLAPTLSTPFCCSCDDAMEFFPSHRPPQVISIWAPPPTPLCALSGEYVMKTLYSHCYSNAIFLLALWWWFIGNTSVLFGGGLTPEYSSFTLAVLTTFRVIIGLQKWMYLIGSGTEDYAARHLPPNARITTPARLRRVSRLFTRSHWPEHTTITSGTLGRTSRYSWLAAAFKWYAWVNELCKFLIYSGHTTRANPGRASPRFLVKKAVLKALKHNAPSDGHAPKHSPKKDKSSGPFPLIRNFVVYSEPSIWANAPRASPRFLATRAGLSARQYDVPTPTACVPPVVVCEVCGVWCGVASLPICNHVIGRCAQ